jgi:DNA-binding CsgD family transcriptional regulator
LRPFAHRVAVFGSTEVCLGAVARSIGRLLALRGERQAASASFEEALTLNERIEARPWWAHTAHELGEMLLGSDSRDDRVRGRDLVARAVDVYREIGVAPFVKRAAALIEGGGYARERAQAPDVPGKLSVREIDVLRLIADGRSNGEIGEKLFISVNTVACHVSHILTKTGAANRAEAVRFAGQHGLVD